VAYKPLFRSQFDWNGQRPDYPDDRNTPINGRDGRYWWDKNCTFSAAAMAMDFHTLGAQRPTPNQLRDVTGVVSPRGSGIDDQRRAWAKADEINGAWSPQVLEVDNSDTWDNFVARIRSGRGAVIIGFLPKIPGRYRCQPGVGYRGNHAMFVSEMSSDGKLLVFDPLCRPSDNVGGYVDRSALDPHYVSEGSEAQPRWVPGEHVKRYCEGWFGYDSRGNPRRPGRVYVGYTKEVHGTFGEGTPTGDVWATYSTTTWRENVVPAAGPGAIDTIQRVLEPGEAWEGYIQADGLRLSAADQVISGEEGRVSDWQPTAMGYGVQGPGFYLADGNGVGVKSRNRGWHLHPWDIPAEHFWIDAPKREIDGRKSEWPEGDHFLSEAVTRLNRETGAQAVEIVNRGGLWPKIELGGVYTLDLSLQGPHPGGLRTTMRVVAFIPDEDSGTMQLLCEHLDEDARDGPPPDPGCSTAVEAVIAEARTWLGVEYDLGGEQRDGVDCSGLIWRIFKDTGYGELVGTDRKLSAGYARWFANRGWFSADLDTARRGDLIVYGANKVSHIGIYLGRGRCISALLTTGVSRHDVEGISKPFRGVLRVQYPNEAHPGPADITDAEDDDPDDSPDAPDSIFPRMAMWWPYWKGRSLEQVEGIADEMAAMNQRGVVLMGMDWNSPFYELPASGVHERLDAFTARGIEPWVGLWVKQMDSAEQTVALNAWNAGGGRWAGAVIDAEAAWKEFQRTDPAGAVANITAFTAALRAAGADKLAVSTYGVPHFHTNVNYELLNEHFDLHLPQIYFSGEDGDDPDDVDRILTRAFNGFKRMSEGWSTPLKQLVPTVNAHGPNADPANRRTYADRALAKTGAMSWWRYPIENPDVVTMLEDMDRDAPEEPNCEEPPTDPKTPPLGDPALKFYTMRVDPKPWANGMMYALCTLLRKLGYLVGKDYGMTLRRASGVPIKVNGEPVGTTIEDTKTALAELIPDAAVKYGAYTNEAFVDALEAGEVIRVMARYEDLTRHLKRWIRDDAPWRGLHAIVIAKTKVVSGTRWVWWMDPMGKPSEGYSGEWVKWSEVKDALVSTAEGIRYTATVVA
jgi:hypothetical protein